jgi:Cys-tRNA(Pro)/Cys-tRNA(Cys) deacylase
VLAFLPMKTRAMDVLDRAGVAYTVREFQEEELGAAEVAEKLGIPLDQVCKTLVVRGDRTGVVLVCLPGTTTLSLKSLARASNNKQVALVETDDILRLTGYIRGGVSPLGAKRRIPCTWMRGSWNSRPSASAQGCAACRSSSPPRN